MTDDAETLTKIVGELNRNVVTLTKVLQDDYPKRTEIERRFQSRLDARKHLTRIILAMLITVVGCYAVSTGAYAVCFVGEDNPNGCRLLPGYEDRIDRRDEINRQNQLLNERISRLERQVKGRG